MKEKIDSRLPGYTSPGVDAQTKKETEANDPVSNMKTHEEFYDPLPETEPEKGYSKKDTDPRKLAEPASNVNKTITTTANQ